MKNQLIVFFIFISALASAKTYYVAPTGKDSFAGSITEPWLTWSKAFQTAQAGDTVFFRGGTYYTEVTNGRGIRYSPASGLGDDGTAVDPICYFNYPGEIPVLDCAGSGATYDNIWNVGIFLDGVDFVHIKGLQIRNVKQRTGRNDLCLGIKNKKCNHLKLENLDIGYIDGNGLETENAYYLEVINCDSHDCCDYNHATLPGGWASGYHGGTSEFTNGYMYFYGCRAWNCSDQGFAASGPISLTAYDNCWSYDNGALNGDGHGWKLGYWLAPSDAPLVIKITNCISANNRGDGFCGNENTGTYAVPMNIYSNFSYNNGAFGMVLYNTNATDDKELKRIVRNNIAYKNKGWYEFYAEANSVYTHSNNSWDHPVTVSDTDFVNIDYSQLKQSRLQNGSLPYINFGKLRSTSDLINAGATNTGLPFNEGAPDLGWSEFSATPSGNIPPFVSISSPVNNALFAAPATIKIDATTSDSDGTIKSVEFFINGVSVAKRTGMPYTYTLEANLAGTYSITAVATDNLNAEATSSAVEINVAIEKGVTSEFINLYPNPNNGQFSVDLFSATEGKDRSISVTNMAGQTVYSRILTDDKTTIQFDLSYLASGTYIVVTTSDNIIVSTQKFTKE